MSHKVCQISEQFMDVMEDSPVKCHINEQLVSVMGRCPRNVCQINDQPVSVMGRCPRKVCQIRAREKHDVSLKKNKKHIWL